MIPWAVAAAGITATAGIGSSLMQSSATKDAQSSANAAQQAALAQARSDLEPWRTTGGSANTAASDLLGLNGAEAATAATAAFQASPGYQWQLEQGLRATDAGAAAKGFGRSGAVLKAEQTFGSGLANQEFSNYYNRLFDMSKLGESAAAGSATASQNTGSGIAGTDVSSGATQTSIYGNVGKNIGTTANTLLQDPSVRSTVGGWFGSSPSYASLDPYGQSVTTNY